VRLAEAARFAPAAPLHRRLVADAAVREAIAKALDLVSIERLEAELAFSGWFDGARIDGRWRADITQTCGVTLDDFPVALSGEFTVHVVPKGSPRAAATDLEVDLDVEAEDPPDEIEGDLIDVGGYVVEHLALEIDPFPRKPGAVFEPPPAEPEASPFAALGKLTPRKPGA
jgi:hypothetical protein